MRRELVLVVLLMLSAPTQAQPGPAIDYLMQEPLTLLDMGIFRLEQRILSTFQANAGGFASLETPRVSYDPDPGEIVIGVGGGFTSKNAAETDGREACREFIRYHRQLIRFGGERGLARLFGHSDPVAAQLPRTFYLELADRIVFRCEARYFDPDQNAEQRVLKYESVGRLMENRITESEGEVEMRGSQFLQPRTQRSGPD